MYTPYIYIHHMYIYTPYIDIIMTKCNSSSQLYIKKIIKQNKIKMLKSKYISHTLLTEF